MSVHCSVAETWTDDRRRLTDAIDEAIERVNNALAR